MGAIEVQVDETSGFPDMGGYPSAAGHASHTMAISTVIAGTVTGLLGMLTIVFALRR
jgi:hypothetical protein